MILIAMALLCIALISWAGSLTTVDADAETEILETATPLAAGIFPLASQE